MDILLIAVVALGVLLVVIILLQPAKSADGTTAFGGGKQSAASTSFSGGAKLIAGITVFFFVMIFITHINNRDKSDALIERLQQRAAPQNPADETMQNTEPTRDDTLPDEETITIPQ